MKSIADFDFTQINNSEIERLQRGYLVQIDDLRARFAYEHGISFFDTEVSITPNRDNSMLLHINIWERSIHGQK